MSQVFREVTFTYGGRDYTLVPSISLLRRFKAKGINTMLLAQQCIQGGSDVLDLVTVHQTYVVEAGGDPVSEEDSYAWLTGGNVPEIMSFQSAFVASVLPGIDLGKKPVAQGSAKPAKKKPVAKKST